MAKKTVFPYIPNSVPEIQAEMMKEIGIKNVMELYEEIPDQLLYKEKLDIPEPVLDEYSILRQTESILAKNQNCKDNISFLGAGCARHYTPAVVDEIVGRGELYTSYGAESWADRGKYQIFFEYASHMAELLDTEVLSVPQYDGAQALSTSIGMANRINGRKKVLVPCTLNPENLAILKNNMQSVLPENRIRIETVACDPRTGNIDVSDLKKKLDAEVAAVIVENPSFLGYMEIEAATIGELARDNGSEYIVYTDPISLGVLEAPGSYGATIVCGDLHSLGLHLLCGGGQAGFISTSEDPKYLYEYKDFIYGMVDTVVEGEYGFGLMLLEQRMHYALRAKGKEYSGTGTNLWMVVVAVYLSLMGPQGMKEVGTTILQNSQYTAKKLLELKGVRLPYSAPFFKEFVVDFTETGKTVEEINKKLLKKGIFGGLDLSESFPHLGQSALYCVTETTTTEDIGKLLGALKEIL